MSGLVKSHWSTTVVKADLHFRCMAGGKKGATLLVKLISTAGTGFFYVAKKNPRKLPNKLQVQHLVGGLSARLALSTCLFDPVACSCSLSSTTPKSGNMSSSPRLSCAD